MYPQPSYQRCRIRSRLCSRAFHLFTSQSARIVPRQPSWLNRTEFDQLLSSIQPRSDGVSTIEHHPLHHRSHQIHRLLQSRRRHIQNNRQYPFFASNRGIKPPRQSLVLFPSLSSREKRRDLVEYAPRFGRTGFVLAGKLSLFTHPTPANHMPMREYKDR